VSLRTRLLVGLAVLVLVAVASSGWLVLQVARARLEATQLDRAQILGRQLAAVLEERLDERGAFAEAARRLEVDGAIEVVALDGSGVPLYGDASNDGALRGAIAGAPFVIRRAQTILVYAPLRAPSGTTGAVRLSLSDRLPRALGDASLLLVGVTLVDGGLVLLFGLLFIRRVVGPLEALAQAARRVADGALDAPAVAVTTRGDEIARLTENFNRMTASLRAQRDTLVAQEKLATVGRLAAGVAHEVGNPLAAVLGYADLLLADAPADSPSRDMLERIRKETERIRAIIADLLDYARPPSGELAPVAMRDAVDAAVSLLRPQARFREVTVDNRVDAALVARANESRVLQILINLFLNAADAMGTKGAVTVDGRSDGDAVELTVSDEGPGVPVADRAKIFDPFFTTKDPGQGTGLGLAISRAIAQGYGGDLKLVESESGASFVLTLRV
jgi:signal transduction histidine kinase